MKALLLKDFYVMKKYCKSFLLMELVFLVLSLIPGNNLFFVFYPCIFGAILPVTLMAYDEKSKWDVYSSVLPYTKAQLVSVKYIMGLLIEILLLAVTGIIQAIKMSMNGGFNYEVYLLMMAVLVILSCIASSGCLPFLFKYGVEKGKVAYFVMIGIVCGGSTFAAGVLKVNTVIEIGFSTGIILAMIAAIALFVFSWYLSIRFYKKREIR